MDAGRVNCTTDQVGAKLVTFPSETVVKVFVTRELGCLAPTNQLASRPIRLGDKSTIFKLPIVLLAEQFAVQRGTDRPSS